ncbi:hypothetical protein H6F90_12045 [Trichocoleus sp. FACHB-591]|uniref:DUF5673 domain-containing protein n=1 Tax=Trichocoleus sp. FACHB-591 TaxID=2692872 RepID=UPI0016886A5A|nr:DUF5673 domain-containing protein [Trichocoleus sp. FACHB-591]MBD2095878.1 hypothetical protein [Trichocoleus sp. FACHB-591]
MGWFLDFLIFFVVLIAGSVLFNYIAAERIVGRKAARRNFRYATAWILFGLLSGFALFFVIQLLGRYGWISFYILSAVAISTRWISWFFRKQEVGSLLADVGRTLKSKIIFWIGFIQVVLAVFQTWLFFTPALNGIPEYTTLELEISKLIFWWSFASFSMALGLNKLEFRENGICFMYSLIRWQRINSYAWETDKSNVLTVRFKPRFPLSPGFTSLPIPAKHKEVVSRILAERLPGKRL